MSPAREPHGSRHSKISALLEIHAAPEFDVASDMLTRTSKTDDVAPDASVFPYERDPLTGGRQLEHLAFEVVSTESLSHAGVKAAKLASRGVRRVFAIDIEHSRALEWSRELGAWTPLAPTSYIEDPALAAPLPVADLVGAAKADDAIARALILKQNPVIEAVRAQDRTTARAEGVLAGRAEGEAKGRLEGEAKGRAASLLMLLATRGVSLDPAAHARILDERDLEQLDRWLVRAMTCTTSAELFAAP